jgi:tripartite-type tricarboxylate transporter receptor subunit TctC
VVPFAAGGSSDVIARVIAQKASEKLGQMVYVENRPGAGGTLGTDVVVRAAPDGYTWLLGTTSTLAINAGLYPNLTYKVDSDLTPVSMLAKGPFLLMANPALPVKNLKDVIQYVKDRPGKVTIASSGYGTSVHLSAELFKMMAGLDMVHVPYKGGGPALLALIAGEVQFMINDLPPAIGPIQSGQVRAIAIADTKRNALLPDVPTFAEAGLPDYVSLSWFALLLPKDTPSPIVGIVRQAISDILVHDPDIKGKFETLGVEPVSSTPEELQTYSRAEAKKWIEVIDKANIHL